MINAIFLQLQRRQQRGEVDAVSKKTAEGILIITKNVFEKHICIA